MERRTQHSPSPPEPSTPQSKQCLTVGDQDAGQRLDRFLAGKLAGFSRSALGKLIRSGAVRVDNRSSKAGYRLRSGNSIEVTIPHQEPVSLVPRRIEFPILYEDEALLVLSKPPGLVVHPACGHTDYTLVHGLLHHCSSLPAGDELRPGIVHRLDMDTSGIMLVAKKEEVLRALSADFKNRKIGKVYHAILVRTPREAEGRIVAPIARHPVHRQKMAVCSQGGRYAATRWQLHETLAQGMGFAKIYLETGRTHQIRVHMASIGCPVAGDKLYGGTLSRRVPVRASRHLLHASELRFTHPLTGQAMMLRAPLWPDMQAILDQLRDSSDKIETIPR